VCRRVCCGYLVSEFVLCVGRSNGCVGRECLLSVGQSVVGLWGVIVCCVWESLVWVAWSEFLLFVGEFERVVGSEFGPCVEQFVWVGRSECVLYVEKFERFCVELVNAVCETVRANLWEVSVCCVWDRSSSFLWSECVLFVGHFCVSLGE